MSDSPEPWFSVKCLFSHPSRINKDDGNLYEERITMWRSDTWEEAFRLAKEEAIKYAQESGSIFIDATDAFHLFGEDQGHGSEVWSLMRGSHLDSETYKGTFCCTDKDRAGEFIE